MTPASSNFSVACEHLVARHSYLTHSNIPCVVHRTNLIFSGVMRGKCSAFSMRAHRSRGENLKRITERNHTYRAWSCMQEDERSGDDVPENRFPAMSLASAKNTNSRFSRLGIVSRLKDFNSWKAFLVLGRDTPEVDDLTFSESGSFGNAQSIVNSVPRVALTCATWRRGATSANWRDIEQSRSAISYLKNTSCNWTCIIEIVEVTYKSIGIWSSIHRKFIYFLRVAEFYVFYFLK